MPTNVIVATRVGGDDRPVYFLGYRERLAVGEVLWTPDAWRARWLDEDEAEVEAQLLADLCPACAVAQLPLARIG
jgi:hypothetical protein